MIKHCDELKELNLTSTNLCRDSLNFLANNLTPTIVKLSLQNLKYLNDKHVSVLVKRCSQIKVFDLCHTSIKSMANIIKYLNSTLEELDINRTIVTRKEVLDLKSIKTLKVLNHGFGYMNDNELSGFIRRTVNVAC